MIDMEEVRALTADITLVYFDRNGKILGMTQAGNVIKPIDGGGVIGFSRFIPETVYFFEFEQGKLVCSRNYSVDGVTDSSKMLSINGIKPGTQIHYKALAFLCPHNGQEGRPLWGEQVGRKKKNRKREKNEKSE